MPLEHNTSLCSAPLPYPIPPSKMQSKRSNAANFASNSRLAFLGTWKARLQRMLFEQDNTFHDQHLIDTLATTTTTDTTTTTTTTLYVHMDMDSFFVSMARCMDPTLIGVPMAVVTGLDSWSEVCTASYEARPYGIKKGMWLQGARALYPQLRLVCATPALFARLDKATLQMYRVAECFTEAISPLSCDELMMRVQSIPPTQHHNSCSGRLIDAVQAMRAAVFRHTGCTVSVGIGDTPYTARYATGVAKGGGADDGSTNGVAYCTLPDLRDADLRQLNGVGRKTLAKLEELCGASPEHLIPTDLTDIDPNALRGACGSAVYAMLQSILTGKKHNGAPGDTAVYGLVQFFAVPQKAISRELNWCVRPDSLQYVHTILEDLSQQIDRERHNVPARRVTLRLLVRTPGAAEPGKRGGHGRCDKWSSPPLPIHGTIYAAAVSAFTRFPSKQVSNGLDQIRGIGVHVTLATEAKGGGDGGTRSVRDFFKKGNQTAEVPHVSAVCSPELLSCIEVDAASDGPTKNAAATTTITDTSPSPSPFAALCSPELLSSEANPASVHKQTTPERGQPPDNIPFVASSLSPTHLSTDAAGQSGKGRPIDAVAPPPLDTFREEESVSSDFEEGSDGTQSAAERPLFDSSSEGEVGIGGGVAGLEPRDDVAGFGTAVEVPEVITAVQFFASGEEMVVDNPLQLHPTHSPPRKRARLTIQG